MPDAAGLLVYAGLLGIAAACILGLGLVLAKRAGGLAKPLRGLLFTAAGFALFAVALAAVAGVLLAGTDLGWF